MPCKYSCVLYTVEGKNSSVVQVPKSSIYSSCAIESSLSLGRILRKKPPFLQVPSPYHLLQVCSRKELFSYNKAPMAKPLFVISLIKSIFGLNIIT